MDVRLNIRQELSWTLSAPEEIQVWAMGLFYRNVYFWQLSLKWAMLVNLVQVETGKAVLSFSCSLFQTHTHRETGGIWQQTRLKELSSNAIKNTDFVKVVDSSWGKSRIAMEKVCLNSRHILSLSRYTLQPWSKHSSLRTTETTDLTWVAVDHNQEQITYLTAQNI